VPPAGEKLVSDARLDRGEVRAIAVVVLLDDLERPPAGEHVASDQVGLQCLGDVVMAGLPKEVNGLADLQIGGTRELVERVQVSTCPFGGFQRLRELPNRRHGGIVDAAWTLMKSVRLFRVVVADVVCVCHPTFIPCERAVKRGSPRQGRRGQAEQGADTERLEHAEPQPESSTAATPAIARLVQLIELSTGKEMPRHCVKEPNIVCSAK